MNMVHLLLSSLIQCVFLLAQCDFSKGIDQQYYVTPESYSGSCPGEPCHALDYYSTYDFKESSSSDACISLYFLSGIHNLSRVMNISNLYCFKLTSANTIQVQNTSVDKVVIHLDCQAEFCQQMLNITKVTVEFMEFRGSGKLLLDGISQALIHHTTFTDSGLYTLSNYTNLQSNLTVQHVQFSLESEVETAGQFVTCGSGFSKITVENILVEKFNQIQPSPHIMLLCDEFEITHDVYMSLPLLWTHNISLTMRGIVMKQTGIQLNVPLLAENESTVDVDIKDCSISHYPGVGIHWTSYGNASLTVDNCTFTNNHHVNLDSVKARGSGGAALSVYSFRVPIQVKLTNCVFQANEDHNYVVYIYHAYVALTDCRLLNNSGTAIAAYESKLTTSGTLSFINNVGIFGGALHLTSTTIALSEDTTLYFINNTALSVGGAIFVNNPLFFLAYTPNSRISCFYELPWNGTRSPASLVFVNNTANQGGHHIYGTSAESYCLASEDQQLASRDIFDQVFTFTPLLNSGLSLISSAPTRICLCDSNGNPQCADLSMIEVKGIKVSPGEVFSLSVVLAGANFGTSRGDVTAYISDSNANFGESGQIVQHLHFLEGCSQVYYSIKSNRDNVVIYLSSNSKEERYVSSETLKESIQMYNRTEVSSLVLQTTLISVHVKLLPCPVGFTYEGVPPIVNCSCFTVFINLGVNCVIKNGVGIFSHSGSVWIDKLENETGGGQIIIHEYCPLEFCKTSNITLNLETDTDSQCAFNRAGRLCGGCRENYSLAIGSSHCIHCPNNNNLALLVFFAAAGLLLVILVGGLNLTINEGLFNGIILYANIVWTYKTILFPSESENRGVHFLQTFLAWLNLDFGIETCFFQGLNAYLKMWLQFVFPLYIWFISGTIVICCHYSSRLTKIFSNKAVPVLVTLICLSYVKLMRIIVDALAFSTLTTYPNESKVIVWSLDGNLRYGLIPHIFLLLTALAVLCFLWIPYTVALTFMQWFRRCSNIRICQWTATYKPFYDCQYSCLQDKHHYWHGALLLVRGLHLIIYALTISVYPTINLFFLQISAMFILVYEVSMQVYKSKTVQLLHGSLLLNLAVLGGSVLYAELIGGQKIVATVLSVSIVFVQFWGLVLWNAIDAVRPLLTKIWNRYHGRYVPFGSDETQSSVDDRETDNTIVTRGLGDYFTRFRDSILEYSKSLESPLIQ